MLDVIPSSCRVLHVAGKSTTISMLTGQLKPTSGDAIVWGQSIRDKLPEVKRNAVAVREAGNARLLPSAPF